MIINIVFGKIVTWDFILNFDIDMKLESRKPAMSPLCFGYIYLLIDQKPWSKF